MSLDPSRWRSSAEYEYVEALEAPDLAWEWLRRNAGYQDDYANRLAPQRLTQHVRRRWGLRFPDQSVSGRLGGYRLLGTRH